MNTFYTHIQPNIIKFSDDESLPEKLRCRYAINYNVWGIDYFFENYLLQESNDGIYMILNENRFSFLLEDSLSDQDVLDIPRLYVLITENFLNNSNKFQEFITRAAKDNEIYGVGINGFKPGVDYYINTTLFNYLSNLQGKSSAEDYQSPEQSQESVIDDGNDNIFGAMTFGAANPEELDPYKEYYTKEEAYEYNLTLPGAISTNTIKLLAQPTQYYTLAEIKEHNDALDIWDENTVKKISYANVENLIIKYVVDNGVLNVFHTNEDVEIPDIPVLHYTQEEIDEHNATLDIWDENTIKAEATPDIYYTKEEVEEYNGNLEGAVHEGDEKVNRTVDPIFRFAHRTIQGTLLEDFESQKIITEEDIHDVNYYSSNEDVARVDVKTGDIQLIGAGLTQITCMFDGDDKYNSASASYLLTVIEEEIIDINLLDIANKLPNYLDKNGNITRYFVDLSNEIVRDYTNLDYFNNKNKLLENHFSESELNNFYQGISNIILAYSEIQNTPEIFNTPKNQIYNIVLKYFGSSQVDDASIALNTILNSTYTVTTNQSSCGCSGINSSVDVSQSCSSLYNQAMQLYIKQMFGDIEFYEDWFSIIFTETEKYPNDVLIETLQLFIKEFISIDYNLDVSKSSISYNCECEDRISLNNSSLEYKKLNNFLQILDWVNNEQLDANSNKIKIYGEAFGELLPKLQF